ncbi:hypothetical protein AB0I60_18765 [Actinosynnema sp. NPDC050436]|uniref:hypothetical protein n=1 Tax=Actinosynnema sp. NPDC050436 TaxID=3155659 RepID=UPI0034065380
MNSAMCAVVLASATVLAAQSPASAADCTLTADAPHADRRSCVDTSVSLDRLPAVGESATVTVTVRSEVPVAAADLAVRIPPALRLTDPAGLSAPRSAGLAQRSGLRFALPAAGRAFTFGVTAVAPGPAQVEAEVTPVVDRARPARSSVAVTVGDRSGSTRPGVAGADSAAVARTGQTTAAATAGRICAKGVFTHTDDDGTWQAVRNARVDVQGRATANGAIATYATGLTSAGDGSFSLCFTRATALAQVWVRFTADSGLWQVRPFRTTAAYNTTTAVKASVASGSTVDFGHVAPADIHMRGWHAFDTVTRMWGIKGPGPCWTSNQTSGCRKLSIWWEAGHEVGAHWDNQVPVPDRHVELSDADPDSEHLVVHESAHGLMDMLYDGEWPVSDCPDPHLINRRTGTTCAWTEGFANAVAGHAMGDGRFVFVGGVSVDLMNTRPFDPGQPNSATNLQDGDQVEARVAGALITLWRKVDGGARPTFDSMVGTRSKSFRDWFAVARPAAGLDVSARTRDLVRAHTIDYR